MSATVVVDAIGLHADSVTVGERMIEEAIDADIVVMLLMMSLNASRGPYVTQAS